MKKLVEEHILKQTRDKLGRVEIEKTKSVKYRGATQDAVDLQNIIWRKQYYTFDRGSSFAISRINYNSYVRKRGIADLVSNDSGGCYDSNLPAYLNASYSVSVKSDKTRSVTLPVIVDDYINLSFYTVVNGIVKTIIAPNELYYINKTVTFTLLENQWTDLYFYVYTTENNSFVNFLNGIMSYITSWKPVGDIDLSAPEWWTTPITTESDAKTGVTKNTLQWHIPSVDDWAGHKIYRKTTKTTKTSKGAVDITNKILTDSYTSDYGSGEEFNVGENTYQVKDYNVVLGNYLYNGGFSEGIDVGWSNNVTDGTIDLYYGDYLSNGVCAKIDNSSTVGCESSLLSSPYIRVYSNLDYSISFEHKKNKIASSFAVMIWYSSNDGSLCSTSSASQAITSTADNWNRLSYNIGSDDDDFIIPSDCKYTKFKFYGIRDGGHDNTVYLDNVKISKRGAYVYSEATTDAYAIETTKKQVPSKDNNRVSFYLPFVSSTQAHKGSYDNSTGFYTFRTHKSFNVMSGGISLTNKHTNLAVAGDLSTTNGWSTSGCMLDINSNTYYDALFNGYCGRIHSAISTSASYISQNVTVYDAESYMLSVYARGSGNIWLCASGDSVATTSSTLNNSWTRYKLQHTTDGTDYTFKIGVSSTNSNNLFVDGIVYEHNSMSFPSIFDPDTIDGATESSAQILICSSVPHATDRGSFGFYWIPSFDYTSASGTMQLLTFFEGSDSFTATEKVIVGYNPTTYNFYIHSHSAGADSIVSASANFKENERVFIGVSWADSSATLYVNSASYNGTYYHATVSNLEIGGLHYAGTNYYNTYGLFTDLFVSTSLITLGLSEKYAVAEIPAPNSTSTIEFTKWEHIATRENQNDTQEPLTYDDKAVNPGQYYIYGLRVFDNFGNESNMSATAGILTGDSIPPDPITDTASLARYDGTLFKWKNPSDTDFLGCNIYANTALTTKIDDVTGLYGSANSYFYATTTSTKIWITTYDRLYNENTAAVYIYGDVQTLESVTVEYSSPNPVDKRQGKLYRGGLASEDGGSTYIYDTADYSFYIDFSTEVESMTFQFYDANDDAIPYSSRSTSEIGAIGNTYRWKCEGDYSDINYSPTIISGTGYIRVTYYISGNFTYKDIPVEWDVGVPNITGDFSFVDESGSAITDGRSTLVRVKIPFSDPVDDETSLRSTWISFTGDFSSPSAIQKYDLTEVDATTIVPVVIPNVIDTYTFAVRVYDLAGNYNQFENTQDYEFKGSEISLSVDCKLDKELNENGWLNAEDLDVSLMYYRATASVSEGDSIVGYTFQLQQHSLAGVITTSTVYSSPSWDGSEADLDTELYGFFDNYAGKPNRLIFTAFSESGQTQTDIRSFNYDPTTPIITGNDILNSAKSVTKARGALIKINKDKISDSFSGYWKTEILRSDDGGSNFSVVGTLYEDADAFYDYDEALEGYRLYRYKARAYDIAGNTSCPANDYVDLLMTPDWEFTYRNKINNGSFEVFVDKTATSAWESWTPFSDNYSGADRRKITDDHACFGNYSFYSYGENDSIYTNGIFLPETTMRPDNYIFSYYKYTGGKSTLQYYLYDYKDSALGLYNITDGNQNTEGTYTGSDGETWTRYYAVINADGWSDYEKQATKMLILIMNDGYLDGVMLEEATASQTTPTTFRDNKVMTTDRFEAGYIYGNMIKAANIHGGHIHANGLTVSDEETGAPSITIGQYDEDKTFIRMLKNGFYYHPSAYSLGTGEGFNFVKHIETGATAFGSSAYFQKVFTDWNGNKITPNNYIWTPYSFQTYTSAEGMYQQVQFVENINSTAFYCNAYLVAGDFAQDIEGYYSGDWTYSRYNVRALSGASSYTLSNVSSSNTITVVLEHSVNSLGGEKNVYDRINYKVVKGGTVYTPYIQTHYFDSTGKFFTTIRIDSEYCKGADTVGFQLAYPNPTGGDITRVSLISVQYIYGDVTVLASAGDMGSYRYFVTDGYMSG